MVCVVFTPAMPILERILELPIERGFVVLYHTCPEDEKNEIEASKHKLARLVSPRKLYSWQTDSLFPPHRRPMIATPYDHTVQRSMTIIPHQSKVRTKDSAIAQLHSGIGLTTRALGPVTPIVVAVEEDKAHLESSDSKDGSNVEPRVVSEANRFVGHYFAAEWIDSSAKVSRVVDRMTLEVVDDSKQVWSIKFDLLDNGRSECNLSIKLSLP